MSEPSKPIKFGPWSVALDSTHLGVILSRHWSTSQLIGVTWASDEPIQHWTVSRTYSLDEFAARCPQWIVDVERSETRAGAYWRSLCDVIADELSAREALQVEQLAKQEGRQE